MTSEGRIDIHAHVVAPVSREWVESVGYASGHGLPPWTLEATLTTMDDEAVAFALLSIPMPRPQVEHDDRLFARETARRMNETSADLVRNHPDRFAFLATVPLPDVEGALDELAYAFDELGACGVLLLANVKGRYLGDAEFEPLMDELERRRATVFVHPASLPGPLLPPELPAFSVDYMLDTSRAAVNLVRSGTTVRHPNVKFVLAHAGAFVPYTSHRIAYMTPFADEGVQPQRFLTELGRFNFDTALSASRVSLAALLAFSDTDHLLFGSDWTFALNRCDRHFTEEFANYPFDEGQRTAIERGNAIRLFGLQE